MSELPVLRVEQHLAQLLTLEIEFLILNLDWKYSHAHIL